MPKVNIFQKWMAQATFDEKTRMAELAGTTIGTLRQAAGAYRTDGQLHVEPVLARRIELATIALSKEGKLPVLPREKLSPACAGCEFAKRCRKGGA